MDQHIQELSTEDRERLAQKGRILYRKSCGVKGKGNCAERFALYHIWKGRKDVARDLLDFLETEVEALRVDDPQGHLALAEELAARIQRHLETEGDDPPEPSQWASILKANKRG